jgi:predicted RNase H-like HicB family nuclease
VWQHKDLPKLFKRFRFLQLYEYSKYEVSVRLITCENGMNRFSMIVQWSDEDRLFLVTIPEFADRVVMPCTHGKTREEVIRSGEEVIEMYLEEWKAEGEFIPEPSMLQIS